jgi:hypothetical protein
VAGEVDPLDGHAGGGHDPVGERVAAGREDRPVVVRVGRPVDEVVAEGDPERLERRRVAAFGEVGDGEEHGGGSPTTRRRPGLIRDRYTAR